ncbi:RagB/SusD family nutrient uptake outer membrane protein [Carboxylicivirga taeanensis]|uniref:RagB/SusD family nutrient uptake outer membrane protein n=1 Tax=Carboxylicivirga taeanensis TaxID=1416875 RepID=UPI003F6DFDA2
MKHLKYLSIILLLAFTACDDFLQREPMDFGSDEVFFKDVNDMSMFTATFYKKLPGMNNWWGGIYATDNNSDNQASHWPDANLFKGQKQTPLVKDSEWKFEVIRDINYFIDKIEYNRENAAISGSEELVNHYLGEAYFFRAYDYFRLLSNIGDVPIIKTVLSDKYEDLVAASQRAPRNEVARFILSDLDKAASLLLDEEPETGRLNQQAALLFKSRVALFEGTWLKYHQGTALAPGNSKWPGSKMYPDFAFAGGSIESEYNYFFEQAYTAADAVAQQTELYDNYQELFNRTSGIEDIDEVILAVHYSKGIASHSATHYLARTGGGTGLTRACVESFLLTDGRPVYADVNNLYQGDAMVHNVIQNRDNRLVQSVKDAGFVTQLIDVEGQMVEDTIVDYLPNIYFLGNQGTATGYELKKWISYEEGQDEQGAGTSAVPVFRAAEAYLNYLEAYYERHNALDGKCDLYWKALRKRAGVNEDYQLTISLTDLSRENDLATKSRNTYVSPTLYNIRRERRCEFVAEGLRFLDLKRWRALDHMVKYNVEGINLWEQMHELYEPEQITADIVSQPGMGNYIQPLKLNSSAEYYDGYTFPKAHYLEPIPVSEIIMTSENGDVSTSPIYQNPGWPAKVAGTADYSADLD